MTRYPSLSQIISSGRLAAISRTVSPNAAVLFMVLRHRQRGRHAFSVSRKELAEQSGISERRINDVLSELTSKGIIVVEGQGRHRTYGLKHPADWLVETQTSSEAGNRLPGRGGLRSREQTLLCLETTEAMGLEGPEEHLKIQEWVARRTTYRAINGYVCRSRAEAMVCDRLHSLGISHRVEVPYQDLGIPVVPPHLPIPVHQRLIPPSAPMSHARPPVAPLG